MKYDPRFTEIRSRCQNLARKIRQSKTIEPDSVAQIAEDLAQVAEQLNSLLNQLYKASESDEQGFRPF